MKPAARRLQVPLALCLIASVPASAQQPVFRSRVALGTIDVTVVDRNGLPIAGLDAGDFTVRVNGRPRDVRAVTTLGGTSAIPTASADPRTRDTATNTNAAPGAFERRVILILFDDLSFDAFEGRQLAESASRFVSARPAEDLVGVFSMSGLGPQVAPTLNREQSIAALRRYVGQRAFEVGLVQDYNIAITEAIAITDGDTATLDRVFDRECRPTLGDYMNEDLAGEYCVRMITYHAASIAREVRLRTELQTTRMLGLLGAVRGSTAGAQLVLMTRGIADPGGQMAMDTLARAAAEHNVTVFALHQQGRSVSVEARRPDIAAVADRAIERHGLESAVDAMGGIIMAVAGSSDRHFDALGRQLNAIYRIGFALDAGDEDGRTRRVEIKVNGSGLRVLPARRAMSFAAAAAETDVVPASPEARLQQLLTSLAPASAIPITARAFVARDPLGRGLRLTVAGLAETTDAVRAAFQLSAGAAAIASGTTPEPIEPNQGHAFLGFTAVVPPGDYVFRLAVLSSVTEAAGTLAYPFRARLTQAGELVLADPVLWTGEADRPRHAPRTLLSTATGFHARIEAYPAGAAESVSGYELVMSVTAPDNDGALVTTQVPLVVESEGTAATAWLPVDAVPTGDYLLRTAIRKADVTVATIDTPFSLERLAHETARIFASPDAATADEPAVPAFDANAWFADGGLVAVADAFSRGSMPLSESTRRALGEASSTVPSGGTTDALVLRIVSALRQGHLDLAALSLEALTQKLAGSPSVLVLTGAVYAARGHDREAVAAWATAEAAGADDPAIAVAMIDALRRLELPAEANERLADALRRWPLHPGVKARAIR